MARRGVTTLLVALLAAAMLTVGLGRGEPSTSSAADGRPGAAAGVAVRADRLPRPKMRFDPIPYGKHRKRQMAKYSKRHYGERSWRLRKTRALVLHYTAGSSYSSAWSTFASNSPALGERPGVCAQFVVDKDGTIYQLVRMSVRCRHAVGINHRSLGIEMVQEQLGGSHATARAILDRKRQARAAVRLVAWLKQRYRIKIRDLIGHAMVNDSRFFKDRKGWRNDHSDWQRKEVRVFRKRVKRRLRAQKRLAAARSGRIADGDGGRDLDELPHLSALRGDLRAGDRAARPQRRADPRRRR